MTAYPLERPLSTLSPTRRVYVVRRGTVYFYPASIVRDIANDLYTMDDDRPWTATGDDWHRGRLVQDRVGLDLVDHAQLKGLARVLWINTSGVADGFDIWWESVNVDASPEWIGAAACVAAREIMTYPLFQHRHLVDDVHTFP